MICAAESGLTARITRPAMTRFSQTSNGIFPSVMPGQRMHRIVAIILIAVPMLPIWPWLRIVLYFVYIPLFIFAVRAFAPWVALA